MNKAWGLPPAAILALVLCAGNGPRSADHLRPAASSLLPPVGLLRFADPDAGVTSGRDALGSRRRYPWYDGESDGLRRLDFRTARKLSTGNWNFSFFNLSLFELIAWTVVLAVFGLLFYWLIRVYLNREKRAALSQAGEAQHGAALTEAARVEALPFQIKRGTSDLLGEARRNYEQGDYGEAVIYLFSYQLVEMDRSQVIRLTKGKTNRQYMREIGSRRTLRELVGQTMTLFEDVFFGDYSLHRERFESCWTRLGEFERLVDQGVA